MGGSAALSVDACTDSESEKLMLVSVADSDTGVASAVALADTMMHVPAHVVVVPSSRRSLKRKRSADVLPGSSATRAVPDAASGRTMATAASAEAALPGTGASSETDKR